MVSLSIIIILLVRKFPKLVVLDVSTLQEEKDSKIKGDIIERRFIRVFDNYKVKISKFFYPFLKRVSIFLKSLHNKLYRSYREIEKKEIEISNDRRPEKKKKQEVLVRESLEQGKELIVKGEFDRAEDLFIDILKIDKKNINAYEGLIEIYDLKKEPEMVKETLVYILKLVNKLPEKDRIRLEITNERIANLNFKLGEILKISEKNEEALEYLKEAVTLSPNKPKYLDMLIEVCIILKKVRLARETLFKLRQVNPDNNKIDEFSRLVREL